MEQLRKTEGNTAIASSLDSCKMEKYKQEGCSKIPRHGDTLRENVKALQQRLELPEDQFVVKLQFGTNQE